VREVGLFLLAVLNLQILLPESQVVGYLVRQLVGR
jgi:hypothetical protein